MCTPFLALLETLRLASSMVGQSSQLSTLHRISLQELQILRRLVHVEIMHFVLFVRTRMSCKIQARDTSVLPFIKMQYKVSLGEL
ncbi:hypothetical protein BD560DRAFT_402507 [Blakeslea trispora]|nr:hypothetical protein BD560DRAFT_402507 [Blakeslea trispora]